MIFSKELEKLAENDHLDDRFRLMIFEKSTFNSNGCLIWSGPKQDKRGYATIYYNKSNVKAHRLSYFLFKGDLIRGMLICHHCDTPSCVNPNHLYQGTPKNNSADIKDRNRHGQGKKLFCLRGHEFTMDNTFYHRNKFGAMGRHCRSCNRMRAQKSRDKFKEIKNGKA